MERGSSLRRAPHRIDTLGTAVFWIACAALLVVVGVIAAHVRHGGTPDSLSNLATARNLARGEGFTSHIVQQLSIPEQLPGPEVVRAPGLPCLLGIAFLLFGPSLAVAAWLNGLIVVATAVALRRVGLALGGRWVASALGILVLVDIWNYELNSIWNNNLLTLAAVGLLAVAVANARGGLTGFRTPLALAALSAAGYLVKQSFVVSAVPFSLVLLASDPRTASRAGRIRHALLYAVLAVALGSPLWLRNLVLFADPLYAPANTLRLVLRHALLERPEQVVRHLAFGGQTIDYRALVARLGLGEVVRREFHLAAHLARAVFDPRRLVILLWGACGFALARGARRRLAALALLLVLAPLFDCSYMTLEARYLWPIVPVFLFLGLLGTVPDPERASAPPATGRSARAWLVPSLAVAVILGTLAPLIRTHGRDIMTRAALPAPEWAAAVRRLPPGAMVMTTDPWGVAWYGERLGLIAPCGDRRDLAVVQRHYRPGYLLVLDAESPFCGWRPEPLRELDHGRGWALYRLARPAP